MSFNITPNQILIHLDSPYMIPINISTHYIELGRKFCETYYHLYDNNLFGLNTLYLPNSCITFLGEELKGFCNFITRVRQQYIRRFAHHNIDVTVQPIGDTALIITNNGTVSVNDSVYTNKFTETLFLQRCDNTLYITNSIFKLIE